MVRLGKTFGNLMVDLRDEHKFERGQSHRSHADRVSVEEADALLAACGGR
jgi:N-acetylmuramic acid 6-phosphate (MurNAc-6-P) etherase